MKSISNFFCFRSLLLKTHQLPLDAYVVALKGMKVNKAILKGSQEKRGFKKKKKRYCFAVQDGKNGK